MGPGKLESINTNKEQLKDIDEKTALPIFWALLKKLRVKSQFLGFGGYSPFLGGYVLGV